jgi:hypothetical protein
MENAYAEIPTLNTAYIDAIFKGIARQPIFLELEDYDSAAKGLTHPTNIFISMNCSSLSTCSLQRDSMVLSDARSEISPSEDRERVGLDASDTEYADTGDCIGAHICWRASCETWK